ncbi:hypothetical protein FHV99_001639 [Ochrobactrum sp. P20RRXII]|nr:DUF4145 domain-containing protein [Ochrobactrum sp. P20RRXII]NIH74432.1 hypothetical protein [Ochrobactrum sp. P20RRXII]
MAILTADCPHGACNTKRSGMVIFGVKVFPKEQRSESGKDYTTSLYKWQVCAAAQCQVCNRPVSSILRAPIQKKEHDYNSFCKEVETALLSHGSAENMGYRVVEMWPIPSPAPIPQHLPAEVEKAFKGAERNFFMEDGEDAAAMLYRRSLDIAIRIKYPEMKGLLAPRIAELTKKGLLPPQMKEWADHIRLIGNDGAHEPEGVSKEDLDPMRYFTEAFLRYFITIPFQVSLHRGEIDENGEPILPPSTAEA